MTVIEVMRLLRKDGWYICEQHGSHVQMKHPVKKGRVTISHHTGDFCKGTLNSILSQAGLEQTKKRDKKKNK